MPTIYVDFAAHGKRANINVNPKHGQFEHVLRIVNIYAYRNDENLTMFSIASAISVPIQTLSTPGSDETIPATANGPTSGRGRRRAYEDVAELQRKKFRNCNITLFSLLSTYSIVKHPPAQKRNISELNVLLELHDYGTAQISIFISKKNASYVVDQINSQSTETSLIN